MKHKVRLLAGLLFLMATGAALFSFAMFQGDRVSWFLFFGFLPIFLYEMIMFIMPFRSWKAERHMSATLLEAGGNVDVELTLERKWPLPIFLCVVEEIFPESLQFGTFGSGGRRSIRMKRLLFPGMARKLDIRYSIEAVSRGVHELVGVRFMATDLFGLVKKEYTIPVRSVLVSYPRERKLHGYEEGLTVNEGMQMGAPSATATVNAAGARPYVPGDRLASIDWKKTARLQEMMTKEFEQEMGREMLLILDACPYEKMDGAAFETSIEIILGIIRTNLGQMTGTLLTIGRDNDTFNLANRSAETAILHHLAGMEQNARRPFYVGLAEEIQHAGHGKDLVIVTSNLNKELTEELLKLRFGNGDILVIYIEPDGEAGATNQAEIDRLRKNGVRLLLCNSRQMAGGGR